VLAATATIDRVGSAQRWRVLGLTGVVALLPSTPAICTAAAVVLSLLVPRTTRGRHLLVCAASWAALSALLYAGIYAPAAHNPFQQQAYERGFLVPGPELRERLPLTLRGTLLPPFFGNGSTIPILPGWPLVVLGAVLLAGLLHSARRNGFWAPLLLAGPLLAATTASALRRYPIGVPRLMVFSAPLLILMAACCVGWAVDASRPRVRPALLVVMGLLAVAPGA